MGGTIVLALCIISIIIYALKNKNERYNPYYAHIVYQQDFNDAALRVLKGN